MVDFAGVDGGEPAHRSAVSYNASGVAQFPVCDEKGISHKFIIIEGCERLFSE